MLPPWWANGALMVHTGRGEPCPQGEAEGCRAVIFKLWVLRDPWGCPGRVSGGEGVAGQGGFQALLQTDQDLPVFV